MKEKGNIFLNFQNCCNKKHAGLKHLQTSPSDSNPPGLLSDGNILQDKLQLDDKFCYLGDILGKGGVVEEVSRTRVRFSWGKFNELAPILTMGGTSLKLNQKIYKTCIQSVLMSGRPSKMWTIKVNDMRRLERAKKVRIQY